MITDKKGKRKSKHGLLLRLSLHKKQVGISGKGKTAWGQELEKENSDISQIK